MITLDLTTGSRVTAAHALVIYVKKLESAKKATEAVECGTMFLEAALSTARYLAELIADDRLPSLTITHELRRGLSTALRIFESEITKAAARDLDLGIETNGHQDLIKKVQILLEHVDDQIALELTERT